VLRAGRATVVVRDDQLSLAIGKRGQNVRLAARLTGWDIDILTPEEFTKGLEIMSETLLASRGSPGDGGQARRPGHGQRLRRRRGRREVLMSELGVTEEQAKHVVEIASAKAKIVAEQQQKDKEEAEAKRRLEAEAAAKLLAGEAPAGGVDADVAAAAILGAQPPKVSASDEARAADILGQGS
jgi:N utilization substance protein A